MMMLRRSITSCLSTCLSWVSRRKQRGNSPQKWHTPSLRWVPWGHVGNPETTSVWRPLIMSQQFLYCAFQISCPGRREMGVGLKHLPHVTLNKRPSTLSHHHTHLLLVLDNCSGSSVMCFHLYKYRSLIFQCYYDFDILWIATLSNSSCPCKTILYSLKEDHLSM